MAFIKAERKKSRLRLGLLGPSGSGKTLTALKVARALGKRVAVIDTERGSASKYVGDSDVGEFDVDELKTFEPRKFVEGMKEAAAAGYDVIVIDSLSHAWMGEGGIIDQKDKRGGEGFAAWRTLTPQHNALIDAILAWPGHVICTMRTKTEYVVETGKDGKTKPRKVGTAPVQRDGMEYEFDVVGEIDVDHVLHVSKSRCRALTDAHIREPGADVAAELLRWLDQGAEAAEPAPRPLPPPEPAKLQMGPVLDLAEAITAAEAEAMPGMLIAINTVVDDSDAGKKMAFALEKLIEHRAAQLNDETYAGDERAMKAVTFLRGALEARKAKVADA